MTIFELCLAFTGQEEGGYANLPGDKGGGTNYGISDARDGKLDGRVSGIPTGNGGTISVPVRQLTKEQARAIYRRDYFDPIKGDQLHPAVAVAVYDFAVNSGTVTAIKALQRACSVAPDGICGRVTVAKANSLPPRSLAQSVCNLRVQFLKDSKSPTVIKYRKALIARANRCAAYCQTL